MPLSEDSEEHSRTWLPHVLPAGSGHQVGWERQWPSPTDTPIVLDVLPGRRTNSSGLLLSVPGPLFSCKDILHFIWKPRSQNWINTFKGNSALQVEHTLVCRGLLSLYTWTSSAQVSMVTLFFMITCLVWEDKTGWAGLHHSAFEQRRMSSTKATVGCPLVANV